MSKEQNKRQLCESSDESERKRVKLVGYNTEWDPNEEDLDKCSIVAEIDEQDAIDLQEFVRDHDYDVQLSYFENEMVEALTHHNTANSVIVREREYAGPLYPMSAGREIVRMDDHKFEDLLLAMSFPYTENITDIVSGAHNLREYQFAIKKAKLTRRNADHYYWISELRKRDCEYMAHQFYDIAVRGRKSFENDYTDAYHHRLHNRFYDSLYEGQQPDSISEPDRFFEETEPIYGVEYHTIEPNIYRCLTGNWYIYSTLANAVEPQENFIFHEEETTIRIKSAPVLGKFQPFSLQALCASVVASNVINDQYDDDTCATLLFKMHENPTFTQLSVRCGPPKSRRIYSLYAIVKNYCIERFTYSGILFPAYYHCVKTDPRPCCSECMNIFELRVSFYACTFPGCRVCDVLKALLFTKTFESMNGHLTNCVHKDILL